MGVWTVHREKTKQRRKDYEPMKGSGRRREGVFECSLLDVQGIGAGSQWD